MSASNLAMMQALMALNPKVSQMVQPVQPNPEDFSSLGEQPMAAPMSFGGRGEAITQALMGPQPPQAQMGPPRPSPAQLDPGMAGPPAPNINQLDRNYRNAAAEYEITQDLRFRGLPGLIEKVVDASKEPKARKALLDAQDQLRQEQTNLSETGIRKRANTVYKAIKSATKDEDMANAFADMSMSDPAIATNLFKEITNNLFKSDDLTDKGKQIGERKRYLAANPEDFDNLSDADKDWWIATGTDRSKEGITTSYNIPAGYSPDDPNNPSAGIHATPGGGPWQEEQENKQTAKVAWRNQMDEVNNVLDVAYDAMDLVSPTSTGLIGPLMAQIGGTDAKDLKEMASTLKANTAFKALFEMRQASKTGGALGNVSNQEIKLLHDSWRSLNQGQSPAQLRKNVQAMITKFERAKYALENNDYFKTIPTEKAYKMVDEHIARLKKETRDDETIPGLPAGFEIE